MDEKLFSDSHMVKVDLKDKCDDCIYPIYFGISCAFFALRLLREEAKNELLRKLEREIEELKKRRSEDAKANEKVVSIYAAQEQSWLSERKMLRQHMGALMRELRLLDKKKNESVSEFQGKLKAMELLVESKEKLLEEEERKRKKAENVAEEVRETAKREAQEHSTELWKHKTAFIEIVSNQRQLEAEMNRAVRQAEAMRQQTDTVLEQKEESVMLAQKLSMQIVKMHKDLEQKDKITSAMLRKSKLDATEKQILLKEAKKKQIELENRRERHSLRSMFATHSNSISDAKGQSHTAETRLQSTEVALEYKDDDSEAFLEFSDVKRLEGWVRSEAGKYATVIEKRHHLELDAFVEQMRLKNEKLEAFRLGYLKMEIESKSFHSHIEGLSQNALQLRHDNMNLEALLTEREEELNCLKMQFASLQKINLILSLDDSTLSHNHAQYKVNKIQVEKPPDQYVEKEDEILLSNDSRNFNLTVQSPDKEFEDEKEVNVTNELPIQEEVFAISSSLPLGKINNKPWQMDIHALGVAYKIKRLKQQLLMLERLTGKQETEKDFLLLMSLLNKQVSRYQSLEGKTDDLCKRMHENDLDKNGGNVKKGLEQFLEETFQLQRYIVATGQKMMEIQSKIVSEFVWAIKKEVETSCSFDMKHFADNVATLFREVQRGLELRIARIIGDLEGTLACQGMMHHCI